MVKNIPVNAGHTVSIPGSPGGRNRNPLQYSCLENPMDRGAWQATVLGVPKSWTQHRAHTHTHTHTHCVLLHYFSFLLFYTKPCFIPGQRLTQDVMGSGWFLREAKVKNHIKDTTGDFSDSPVAKTWCACSRGCRSDPWSKSQAPTRCVAWINK